MQIHRGVIALLLVAGIPVGVWAWSRSDDQIILTVRVFEETDGKSERIRHVDQTMIVPRDGTIDFVDGGELPGDRTTSMRQFGTRISGSLHDHDNRISLKIDFSSRVSAEASDDPDSRVIRGEYVDLQTTVIPGKKSLLHCGGKRWCEVELSRASVRK